jgi:hypothetical protein
MTDYIFNSSHITNELIEFMMSNKEGNKGKNDLISLVTRVNRPKFCNHQDAKHRVRSGLSPLKTEGTPSKYLTDKQRLDNDVLVGQE